jgi:predicted Zn-dependent protease
VSTDTADRQASAQETSADHGHVEGKDLRPVLDRARSLLEDNRPDEAHALLSDTLADFGPDKDVLYLLAQADIATQQFGPAIGNMANAVALDPDDMEVLIEYVYLLRMIGDVGEALSVLEGLNTEMRNHPSARTALGDLYWSLGWPAKAADAYGDLDGLPDRAHDRRKKLRTGGPIPYIRHRALKAEEYEENTWRDWTNRPVLAEILRPLGFAGVQAMPFRRACSGWSVVDAAA